MKNRSKHLLSLAIAVVFIHWTSTPVAAEPTELHPFARLNASRQVPKTADLDGAIADYTRALQFESNDASIFYERGTARQKKNDLAGALADYSKTIEIDPTHASAYANRGVVKVLLQKSDAEADFEAAFRLDPSLRASYGQFYEKRRKP
jgi:tetratricopeptide (TPR) repeat protein